MADVLKVLIVGPFTVVVGLVTIACGLVYAIGFGLIGGAIVGACILIWPFAWLYDAINERLTR